MLSSFNFCINSVSSIRYCFFIFSIIPSTSFSSTSIFILFASCRMRTSSMSRSIFSLSLKFVMYSLIETNLPSFSTWTCFSASLRVMMSSLTIAMILSITSPAQRTGKINEMITMTIQVMIFISYFLGCGSSFTLDFDGSASGCFEGASCFCGVPTF